jgi:hypothetical protein
VLRGRNPATITGLNNLVEIDAYKEGLRFFVERSGGKSTTAIVDLAGSLKAVARHHLRLDQNHLDRLAAINRRLSVGPRALTEKNRGRLRQFDDPDNVAALIDLPHKLIGIASRKRNPRAGALLAQIAVDIAIMIMSPHTTRQLAVPRHRAKPGSPESPQQVIARRLPSLGREKWATNRSSAPGAECHVGRTLHKGVPTPFSASQLHRLVPGPTGRFEGGQDPRGTDFPNHTVLHRIGNEPVSVSSCHCENLPRREPRRVRSRAEGTRPSFERNDHRLLYRL